MGKKKAEKKPKKINQKLLDKMELRAAKILDHIDGPLDYEYNNRETWESLSLKQRQSLIGFLEWAEDAFVSRLKAMDRHVDRDGYMKPKRKRRPKPQPENPEPPRSLADLPPLSSILAHMFRFPPLPIHLKPKDEFPEELDT